MCNIENDAVQYIYSIYIFRKINNFTMLTIPQLIYEEVLALSPDAINP